MFQLSKVCQYYVPLVKYRDSICDQLLKLTGSSINLSSVVVFPLVMNVKLFDDLSFDMFLLLRE